MRSDHDWLRDILDAIDRIERYAQQGRAAFDESDLIQTWMVRNIEVIGEASRGISDSFREAHGQIPWSSIVGMRNILIHKYFDIDADAVWNVVALEIPKLRKEIETILSA